jgi:predicted ATP-dependent serine protease
MLNSNCCGADELYQTGRCSDCKDHAEFKEDEVFISQRQIDWIINYKKNKLLKS